MYATGNPPKQGISGLAFRNQCGRRGCGHIFEYEGPNPLGNIQRLVREHSPFCPGQRPEVTNIFRGRSQQNLGKGREGEEGADVWDEYRSLSEPLGGSRSPSSSGSTIDDGYTGGPSEGGTRAASPSMGSMQSLVSVSSSSTGKKTARSEAERRLTLETDEWTLSVAPHEVVCRGCRRTIKLDRRSRYYPGLWEKHRDRCEGVSRMREAMGVEVRVLTMATENWADRAA
ncbi:hypothetical protein B0H19DRAFT_153332 [Mycena capillaripes]|nr:hypothetical protein B0H19DRAFT_153332 [Mycena capillaripes]